MISEHKWTVLMLSSSRSCCAWHIWHLGLDWIFSGSLTAVARCGRRCDTSSMQLNTEVGKQILSSQPRFFTSRARNANPKPKNQNKRVARHTNEIDARSLVATDLYSGDTKPTTTSTYIPAEASA